MNTLGRPTPVVLVCDYCERTVRKGESSRDTYTPDGCDHWYTAPAPDCRGCDWFASGYPHRHLPALDGPREGCCAHSCGRPA